MVIRLPSESETYNAGLGNIIQQVQSLQEISIIFSKKISVAHLQNVCHFKIQRGFYVFSISRSETHKSGLNYLLFYHLTALIQSNYHPKISRDSALHENNAK